jgi:hypothetical protein
VSLANRHPELANGDDDARRELMQKIAETWRARLGPRFGWKSNHGIGIANSKDAGAEVPAGDTFTPNKRQRLYIWDLFNGTTRKPHPMPVLSIEDNYEQFFVPVEPKDWLADETPTLPVPIPVPPSTDLLTVLRAVRVDVVQIQAKAEQAIATIDAALE